MDGSVCPRTAHAPRSGLGVEVWSLCVSPGLWKLGALGGCAGLDWTAVRARLGDDPRWRDIEALLCLVEAGAMEGAAEAAEKRKADADE